MGDVCHFHQRKFQSQIAQLYYRNYLELSLNLISDNGLIVFDNVLWKGKVANPSINDKKTNVIREFNDFIKNDKRVDTTMISIGDGMTLCQKKKNLRY